MRKTLLAFIVLWFTNCQSQPQPSTPSTPTPPPTITATRGVWITNVDSQVLFSKTNIQDAIDICEASGINTVFVVMWNKGRTLYPSALMKNTFSLPIDERLTGRDPLREMIDAAHAKKIKVFAWFEYGFAADAYGQGTHILQTKPQWAALDKDGGIVTKNNFRWMNAFDPEVQNFVMGLLKEVVTNYPDIDGIQGDDRLPALPSEGGYNPEIVAQYKAENGGQAPPSDGQDSKWLDWRAKRLNLVMKRIYQELKAINPKLTISMAPSVFPFSKTQYLQDWTTWVQGGWVDMICPQIYRYDFAAYQAEMKKIVSDQITKEKQTILAPGVLLNVGTYTATATFLKQMVDENRKNGIQGEVFFFYEGLKKQPDYFRSVYK